MTAPARTDPERTDRERTDVFTGALAPYAEALSFSDDGRPGVPCGALLDEDVFDRILVPLEERNPGADRRAVASLWSRWYFSALVVPAVAQNLVLDRRLPLALDEVQLLLHDEEGRPAGFRLRHSGGRAPDRDPFERFRPLVRGHLEPLVAAVSEHAGLAPHLLWCNAGSYFDWVVRELDSRDEGAGTGTGAATAGRRFLRSRTWPDGRENPLFEPVRRLDGPDGEPVLQRRICCLRYLLPETEDCGALCPLPG